MIFFRFFLALTLVLLGGETASGRVNSLHGSISVLQEYDSNLFLAEDDEQDGWFTSISPSLVLVSKAESDRLSLGYAPGLRIDHENDTSRVEHYLTLEGEKKFSRRFSGTFRENYIRSNDYTYFVREHVQREGAGIPLSRERVRRQYWVNSIALASDYEYARDSLLRVGYSNRILKNDAPGLDDYVRHQPYASLGYRFNQYWESRLSYDYIRGDFDVTEDLDQQIAGIVVNRFLSQHEKIFGAYQFTSLRYDDGPRNEYNLHRGDLGWQRDLDPRSALAASAGVSYADPENGDSETAFNYSVDLTRKIQNGSISIGGAGGMDELQFAATVQDGLSRFWSVRGSADYQLRENVSSHAYLTYREDTFFENPPDFEERSLVAGARVSYGFGRWYAVSVGYSYRQLDSELPRGDYQDHRAYVELSAGKELSRWQ